MVFEIKVSDNRKYYCDDWEDVLIAVGNLQREPIDRPFPFQTISRIEMEEKDYNAMPATNDSYELFSKDK